MSRRPGPRSAGLVAAIALALTATLVPAAAAQPALRPPPQPAVTDPPPGWPAPPAVQAASYLVVDQATGQVLAERDPDTPRAVASTVKILTAITVLRHRNLDDVVTVGDEVEGVGGASVGLRPGDRWTIAQLLDGLVARSGNDAAVALAAAVGGSVDGFMTMMRSNAQALGITDAVLDTPNGLEDRNRLSARDLAVLARTAMADPRFRSIAGHAVVDLPGIGRIATRDELLDSYPGATGIKTGYTDEAGYCLVASAKRAGHEVIAVVLDSPTPASRFTDATALLDHAFGDFGVQQTGAVRRLRRAGQWVTLRRDDLGIFVPQGGPPLQVPNPLPAEIPADGADDTLLATWRGHRLATLGVQLDVPPRPAATGGAGLGRWLSDRAYAAMRAAVADGLWPR